MFTENILGSKAKVKILRVLSEVRTAYSLKSLVEETGLSLSITHKSAEELADEGVLTKIKGTRKERLYKFNAESGFASAVFELFKTEKTKQRRDVILLRTWNILESVLTKIKSRINLMILFGSQVRGEATLKSDIDILIIPKDKVDIEMSETALCTLRASARSKQAVSEHAQKHAPCFSTGSVFDKIKKIDKKINPMFVNLETFKSDVKNKTPLYNNLKKDSIILFIRKGIKEELKDFLQEIEPFILGEGILGRGRLG